MKKAQITLFIIVAIIVIVIILFLIFGKNLTKKETQLISKDEINYIQNYIQNNLVIASQDALRRVGEEGGYYAELPPYYVQFLNYYIPIYVYNNKLFVPTIEKMQEQISSYIDTNFIYYLNFDSFKPIEVSFSDLKTETRIREKDIVIETEWPITLKKGNSIVKISKFNAILPVRLKDIHDAYSELAETHVKYNTFCISCSADISNKYNLNISITPVWENVVQPIVIYEIREEDYKINNEPYLFIFATEYKK